MKKKLKKKLSEFRLYVGFIGLFVIMGGFYLLTTHPFEWSYKSENYPAEDEQQAGSNVLGTKYNYYLDASPSMMGFFEAQNNSMSMLANVLGELNLDLHNNEFYTCYGNINNVIEDDFYNTMFSEEKSNQHYQNIVARGSSGGGNRANEPESRNETIEEELNNLDLSKIFTENYDNDKKFDNEKTVNMIITDMNFLDRHSNIEYHTTLLEKFADNLAMNVGEDNFCIYNIACQFQGEENIDKYPINLGGDGKSDSNHSFFVIVFAHDNNAYNSYINKLEVLFEKNNINYSNNKFELKNNLFENQNEFSIDRKRFTDLDNTTLEYCNFDNKSLKRMPDNAVGIRFIREGSNTAAIRMQVAKFELPGYTPDNGENRNESVIDTIIKIYYPNWFGFQEYTGEDVVERSEAYLEWQNDELWLNYEADFDINVEISHPIINKSYYIVDVQFVMTKPAYTIPEWISAINTEEVPEDWSKKIHINNFIAAVIEKKDEVYENSASEYQCYMGNLLIYVNQ